MMNADRIAGSSADVRGIMITCEENVVGWLATYAVPPMKRSKLEGFAFLMGDSSSKLFLVSSLGLK